MLKILVLLVVLVSLVACGGPSSLSSNESEQGLFEFSERSYPVYRVVDREAAVVCYVYVRGGLSCMPISDTQLDN